MSYVKFLYKNSRTKIFNFQAKKTQARNILTKIKNQFILKESHDDEICICAIQKRVKK